MQEPELTPAMVRRLDELNQRLDRFERIVKELRLEWDEMYDKLRLLYARVAKRIKDAAADAANDAGNGTQSRQDALETTKDLRLGYGHPPLHERAQPGRRNY